MAEWLPPVLALVGVLLGAGITVCMKWMETREKYQEMTFEKRLLVHQEAFSWNARLYQAVWSLDSDEIDEVAEKASDWWQNNCLFLDENSRYHMISALNCVYEYVNAISAVPKNDKADLLREDAIESLSANRIAIERGIGAKHLPELKKKP